MSDIDSEKGIPAQHAAPLPKRDAYKPGMVGKAERAMDWIVEHGVEERGIQPRPVEERVPFTWRSCIPQLTFWAALNTNILTFSEGLSGPAVWGLDLRTSSIVIVVFNAVMCIPPAWLATNGPRLGMRQMVQARYAMGYVPTMIVGLANCLTFIGYLALQSILGGQCLSIASGGDMSWTVGIVVVGVIGVFLSFIGLRALHILSLTSLPIVFIVYVVLVGITGDKLHLAESATAKAATAVTVQSILGFGASQIGYTASYSGMSSDFTTLLDPDTPRWPLFLAVYFGLFTPIVVLQIFGAAAYLTAINLPVWAESAAVSGPHLIYTICGEGGAAKFVMVLFSLSVVANVAPTIYSCGLSGQVVIPYLVRIPRYFLALVVTAIYLPIAIVGSTHFYTILTNFLAVLGYWTAIYLPPALFEPLFFRAPVTLASYPVAIWNKVSKLPIGLAFIGASSVGIPLAAVAMQTNWWSGWLARKVGGDLGFELTFAGVAIVYLPLRYLERKFTGR